MQRQGLGAGLGRGMRQGAGQGGLAMPRHGACFLRRSLRNTQPDAATAAPTLSPPPKQALAPTAKITAGPLGAGQMGRVICCYTSDFNDRWGRFSACFFALVSCCACHVSALMCLLVSGRRRRMQRACQPAVATCLAQKQEPACPHPTPHHPAAAGSGRWRCTRGWRRRCGRRYRGATGAKNGSFTTRRAPGGIHTSV